ncbi:hypothetical protein C2G38_2234928 [Gigaspora rosea]|uniref:Protein kinase domain-containing protein n=1 Tax=Gigaspora rosea TaxID=44941 RepID=A0A397TQ02_9GLOM|nr:hypothetical protein C2G38_2234928 [Gigaspora rosea]
MAYNAGVSDSWAYIVQKFEQVQALTETKGCYGRSLWVPNVQGPIIADLLINNSNEYLIIEQIFLLPLLHNLYVTIASQIVDIAIPEVAIIVIAIAVAVTITLFLEFYCSTNERTKDNFNIDDDVKKLLVEKEYLLSWIPFKKLYNSIKIEQDGFATMFLAMLVDKSANYQSSIAFKLLHGSRSCDEGFIQELKTCCNIGSKHPVFLKCYRISKDESSEDYILVLEYIAIGSLRQNLCSVLQINWIVN